MAYRLTARSSKLIDAIRLPLLIMVVLSHCSLLESNTPINIEYLSGETIFQLSELFIRSLGHLAVAGFAFISGYFFFLREDFTLSFYTKAIHKRKNSLLYPYILWNVIAFIALWAKNTIAQKVGFSAGVNLFEINLLKDSSLLELFLLPIDGPLWYIRDLIVIVLLSPLIGLSFRYLKKGSIFLFIFLYLYPNLNLGLPNLFISSKILGFFLFGAYLARYRIEIFETANKFRLLGYLGTSIFFLALFFICDTPYYGIIRAITSIAVLISLFNWIDSWDKQRPQIINSWLKFTPAVFFIYASHTILIINLVRGFLYTSPLASFALGKTMIALLTGSSALISTYFAYWLMKKLMPKTLAVLSGGRA